MGRLIVIVIGIIGIFFIIVIVIVTFLPITLPIKLLKISGYILTNFRDLTQNLSKSVALISSIIPSVTVVNDFFEKAETTKF